MNRKKGAATYFKRLLQHLPIQAEETHGIFRRGSWSTGQKSRAGSPHRANTVMIFGLQCKEKRAIMVLENEDASSTIQTFISTAGKQTCFLLFDWPYYLTWRQGNKQPFAQKHVTKREFRHCSFFHRILCRNRLKMSPKTVSQDRIYCSVIFKRGTTPKSHVV